MATRAEQYRTNEQRASSNKTPKRRKRSKSAPSNARCRAKDHAGRKATYTLEESARRGAPLTQVEPKECESSQARHQLQPGRANAKRGRPRFAPKKRPQREFEHAAIRAHECTSCIWTHAVQGASA